MSQGGYVTLVGFVAQDPNYRTTATGKLLTRVRVGTTPRYHDKATGQWRDAETSYYNITCWSRLADHVRASLHKGDPVIVKGRFRTNTFEDKNGQLRTSIEITADTVGHDLSRGPANYMRLRPQRVNTGEDLPDGESDTSPEDANPEDANPEDGGTPEGPDEALDVAAIERLGRDLEDAGFSARADVEGADAEDADAEDPDQDDDEATRVPVPAMPF